MDNQKIKFTKDTFVDGKLCLTGKVAVVGKDVDEKDARNLVLMKKASIVIEEKKEPKKELPAEPKKEEPKKEAKAEPKKEAKKGKK
jgi:hypothetical protein